MEKRLIDSYDPVNEIARLEVGGMRLVSDKMIEELSDMNFFTAPASTKYHGACVGGLVAHSLNVMNALVSLTKKLGLMWCRIQSPYLIGLFHDICKCDQYRETDPEKTSAYWEFDSHTLFKGHGDKSVMILSQFYQLTEEEVACIRYHMGAFTDKEEWEYYARAIHKFPNVLWTHTADMMAAHITEV